MHFFFFALSFTGLYFLSYLSQHLSLPYSSEMVSYNFKGVRFFCYSHHYLLGTLDILNGFLNVAYIKIQIFVL